MTDSPDGYRPTLGLIDLAAKRLGGMVLDANDEFFSPKENLLEPLPPVFDPLHYLDRGKVMDGWETRRKRGEGHDWCVIRLGVTGVLDAVIVDTSFFRGNFPERCALEGCVSADGPPGPETRWFPLLPETGLRGDAVQRFPITEPWRVTHVRFSIFPDGGVARLRLLGRPVVDLHRAADSTGRLDLAASINGGRAVACSDAFFSSPHNLVTVGDSRDMGDGWETKRRRGPGEDWAVIELAAEGRIERLEIDTTNFKGNYPDRCAVDVVHAPDATPEDLLEIDWVPLIPPTPMQPHARHVLDVADAPAATHLRLRVIPDGGVSRLRAYGVITADGWQAAGLRALNAMAPEEARAALLRCCGSTVWASAMAQRRPFASPLALADAADEAWSQTTPADWREAFAAHPRIGERAASRWSTDEQAGTSAADRETLEALAEGNRAYEERFGHVFLIRAAGRSAQEMLDALSQRMANDPDTELEVAAEQQRQITQLRLAKLLAEGSTG